MPTPTGCGGMATPRRSRGRRRSSLSPRKRRGLPPPLFMEGRSDCASSASRIFPVGIRAFLGDSILVGLPSVNGARDIVSLRVESVQSGRGTFMGSIRLSAIALCVGTCALAAPAMALEQTYTYSIVHPTFGDIGVFTDRIERTGDQMSIHTQLRVAVHMIGMTVYRESADGVEVMQGKRLVTLENVGEQDGEKINVHGRVEGGRFMVNSPAGSVAAPLDVVPSDPWLVHGTTQGKVVSTRTGQVVDVSVTGGEPVSVEVQGTWVRARH